MPSKLNRFQFGSGAYKCDECGKLTRETGSGESGVGLCKECYEAGEYVNGINDGDFTLDDVPAHLLQAVKDRL